MDLLSGGVSEKDFFVALTDNQPCDDSAILHQQARGPERVVHVSVGRDDIFQ